MEGVNQIRKCYCNDVCKDGLDPKKCNENCPVYKFGDWLFLLRDEN
jgi:hypothetical protein